MSDGDDGGERERPAPDRLELVRGFVNTLDIETGSEALATPAEVAAWFTAAGLLAEGTRVDAAGFTRTIETREAIRSLLLANAGGPPADAAVASLNALADDAGVNVRLTGPATAATGSEGQGLLGALGGLLAIILDAIADGTWQRLKACPADGCNWAYYDASRNRSSRWCSMAVCGNRAKRDTFRQRHGPAGAAP
jgi:predicted RNA-binding Zn ribbon-like protein